jgi:hypothetical protein
MENADSLRKELARAWHDLRARKIKPEEAFELSNIAGKMISSAKVQVEYFALSKKPQSISFLEEPKAEPSGG